MIECSVLLYSRRVSGLITALHDEQAFMSATILPTDHNQGHKTGDGADFTVVCVHCVQRKVRSAYCRQGTNMSENRRPTPAACALTPTLTKPLVSISFSAISVGSHTPISFLIFCRDVSARIRTKSVPIQTLPDCGEQRDLIREIASFSLMCVCVLDSLEVHSCVGDFSGEYCTQETCIGCAPHSFEVIINNLDTTS